MGLPPPPPPPNKKKHTTYTMQPMQCSRMQCSTAPCSATPCSAAPCSATLYAVQFHVTLLPECQSEIIQLHPDLHPVISLLKNDDGRRASYLSGSSKCA